MLCINESDRGAGVRDAAKFHIKIIADAQFPVVVSTGRVVATIVAFGIVLPIAIELLGVRGASPRAVRIQAGFLAGWQRRVSAVEIRRQVAHVTRPVIACIPVRVYDKTFIVIRVHEPSQAQLLLVVGASDLPRFIFGLIQGRQQHRRQDGYDGDHNQQLDKCEACSKGTPRNCQEFDWREPGIRSPW